MVLQCNPLSLNDGSIQVSPITLPNGSKQVKPDGSLTNGSLTRGYITVTFEVEGENRDIPFGPHQRFVVEKSARGSYILHPEKTAALFEEWREEQYSAGLRQLQKEDYNGAVWSFHDIGDYKDAIALANEAKTIFDTAVALMKSLSHDPKAVKRFKPANPDPLLYIACVKPFKDPVTRQEAYGGYNFDSARHYPVDAEDVLYRSGIIHNSQLKKTKNPNQATYALIITFQYKGTGTFTYNDGSRIKQYLTSPKPSFTT